ncbi:MAG TPA: pirin family protein [Candidatus Polarisedimenticolia bacterium]|nr:pirin family protein [Candidatus Polarisedimenticolia bacterium]
MIVVRASTDRGRTRLDWLDSRHTFSFGGYFDPNFVGFRSLRVINDDRVKPAKGFGTHAHNDMEIVSIVLEGALEHKDSLGTGSIIRAGDVQRMSAGTGVTHSEFNPSPDQPVHFLQIWFLPERKGLTPGYEQKAFPEADRRNTLRTIGSRDGRDGSLTIHQDVVLSFGHLEHGRSLTVPLAAQRTAWVHVTKGRIDLNGTMLVAGDGAAVAAEPRLGLHAPDEDGEASFLLFDLA